MPATTGATAALISRTGHPLLLGTLEVEPLMHLVANVGIQRPRVSNRQLETFPSYLMNFTFQTLLLQRVDQTERRVGPL